jgi:hypothetical protein
MAPRPRAPQALEEASDPGRRLRRRTLRVSAAMVSDIGDGGRSQRAGGWRDDADGSSGWRQPNPEEAGADYRPRKGTRRGA